MPHAFRSAAALVAVALVLTAMTGCASRVQYDAAAGWLEEQAGVTSVDDLGHVGGTIGDRYEGEIRGHLSAGLADAEILAIADAAVEYLDEHDPDDYLTFQLADGDFILEVTPGDNQNLLGLLREYQRDPQLTGAIARSTFTWLVGERSNLAEIYTRYAGGLDDPLIADGFDEGGVTIRRSSNMECDEGALFQFVDRLLSGGVRLVDDATWVQVNPCSELGVYVEEDAFVDTVFELRRQWIASGSPEGFWLRAVVENPDDYIDDFDVEVTSDDDEVLQVIRSVESPEFGRPGLHLVNRILALRDDDRNVCELLALVRDADGFELLEGLRIEQRRTGEVSGPRELVVETIDEATSSSGCAIEGSIELG